MDSLTEPGQVLHYPYFLCNPYFEPQGSEEQRALKSFGLRRYGTNSGTASGATWTEAVLHGLLEVIERDAIGMTLLRSVIRKPAEQVCKLDIRSLPDASKELVLYAEQECCGFVEAWDLTADVGVPVMLASVSVPKGNAEARYFGSGASLSPAYAFERALLEAVQYFHVHENRNGMRPKARSTPIEGLPRYVGCFLEGGFFDYRGGERLIELRKEIDEPSDLSPSAQVQRICALLKEMGMRVYARTVVNDPVFVTQVVVPRLERFHLVARGVLVAPSSRGRKVLET